MKKRGFFFTSTNGKHTQNKFTLNNEEKDPRNHFWTLQSGSLMRNTEERRFLSKLSPDFVMKFFKVELYMLSRLFSKKNTTLNFREFAKYYLAKFSAQGVSPTHTSYL